MDLVAQKEMAEVRAKLAELHYFQPAGAESIPLVKVLIDDLTKSVEAFQQYRVKFTGVQDLASQQKERFKVLQQENPRLVKENNDLHRRIHLFSSNYCIKSVS